MATRRERVVLDLQDDFSTKMARAAAATALLKRELNDLSGKAVQTDRATRSISKNNDDIAKSARSAERDIDKLSGRLRILADVASFITPAFVPIGAVAVPAVTGLASALGFATLGAGTAVLAFQGIGDALKSVNKAGLEPTTENLQKASDAMEQLSPAARSFVKELRSMGPMLEQLQGTAAAGLLPGLTTGLDALEKAFPRVERIIAAVSGELGNIAAEGGQSLSGERWAPFLDFLADEAPAALGDLATAIGNTTHALASLWMATTPLNNGFMSWLVEATEDLDRWAEGLSKTAGFQEFVDYIQQNGPQVEQTFGAIANMALQIVEAMAPLGGPVLKIIEGLANAFASIADSDAGTAIFGAAAALGVLNRSLALTESLSKATFGGAAVTRIRTMDRSFASLARGAGVLGGVAAVSSGLTDQLGLTNTASLALAGSFGGPVGTAAGAAVGAFLDVASASDTLSEKLKRADEAAASGNLQALAGVLKEINKESKDLDSSDGFWDGLGDAKNDIFGGDFLSKLRPVPVIGSWIDVLGLGESGSERADKGASAIEKAMAGIKDAAKESALEAAQANGVYADLGDTSDLSADQIQGMTTALIASRNAAAETAGKFIDFGAAVGDSKTTLDQFIQNLNDQATALNKFADNAISAGRRGLDEGLIKQFKELGPAGAVFLDKLANGSDAGIEKANRAFRRGERAAKHYENVIGGLKPAKPVVVIDPAVSKLQQLMNAAKSARSALTTLLNPVNVAPPNIPPILIPGAGKKADGGTIPKTGKPYADRHLYMLADGEEVISNRRGQADRYRPLLKAINHAANGTTVGGLRNYVRDDLNMTWPKTLNAWEKALAKSGDVLDAEREKRQKLIDARSELAGTVGDKFRSDIFDTSGRPDNYAWLSASDRARSAGDPFSILTKDINNAGEFQKLLKVLAAKGLDGQAFAGVAAGGDIDQVRALAGRSKADIGYFEKLYNTREVRAGQAGAYAGDVAYKAQITTQTKTLQDQLAESRKYNAAIRRVEAVLRKNPKATGDAIAKAINGAAPRKRP